MNSCEQYKKAQELYINNLINIGASEQTISNYQKRLSLFFEFWSNSTQDITKMPTVSDVRAWRDYLLNKGLKKTSVKQYLRELSYFFSTMSDPTLGDEQAFTENPVSKRLYPKIEKRPYDLLMENEDIIKLWENKPAQNSKNKLWPRNYAIVITLLTCELRNSELLSLTPADLDYINNEITVEHGKGNKFRIVDFPPIAQTAIKLYMQSGLRPNIANDNEPLFGTQADISGHRKAGVWKKGTPQWLSDVVERHVKAVTGISNIRTHDLRHIGARLDLNSGSFSIEMLQAKLGHENISTTQIYSGRLQARRQRDSVKKVFIARDYYNSLNQQLLNNIDIK